MYDFENCVRISAMNIDNIPYHMSKRLRIVYVMSGEIELSWVSGMQRLKENEIEIINVKEPAAIRKASAENMVVIFEIDMEFAKRYCEDIDTIVYNCNCDLFFPSKTRGEDQTLLKRKLIGLYDIYMTRTLRYKLPSEVMEIVLHIKEHFNDIKNLFLYQSKTDIHVERFLRINHYLIKNLEKKISLKDIADREYLSPHYISKEFNKHLNNNFQNVLDYYRVKKSVQMLISTDESITTIAEKCGFSATRYYNEKFRRYMGSTPVKLREEIRTKFPKGEQISLTSEAVKQAFTQAEMALRCQGGVARIIDCKEADELLSDHFLYDNWIFVKNMGKAATLGMPEWFPYGEIKKAEFLHPVSLTETFLSTPHFGRWCQERFSGDGAIEQICWRAFFLIQRMRGTLKYASDIHMMTRDADGTRQLLLVNCGIINQRYLIRLGQEKTKHLIVRETMGDLSEIQIEAVMEYFPDLAYQLAIPAVDCFTTETSSGLMIDVEQNSVVLLTII